MTENNSTIPVRRCSKCDEEKPVTEFRVKHNQCKACQREYGKRYRAENREKRNKKNRQWRAENREKEVARSRQWHAANREYNREYRRRYRAENKEHLNERGRQWHAANREYALKYAKQYRTDNYEREIERNRQYNAINCEKRREYRAQNRHIYRANLNRYRARKRALPDTWTVQHWQLALEYFNGCCAVCGRKIDLFTSLDADHWIPISSPDCPGTIPENMIPLCSNKQAIEGQEPGCNQSKGAIMPDAWLAQRFGEAQAIEILARIGAFFEWIANTDLT